VTIFGTIWDAGQLEEDIIKFLKRWMNTYLSEVAEQRGRNRGAYPVPKTWSAEPALTPAAVEGVIYPAILVIAGGTTNMPKKKGDGTYEATYRLGITVLTTANNESNARKMAQRYGAALKSAMLQKGSLETDYVSGLTWVDERFVDYIGGDQETVGSATEIFDIDVTEIVNAKAGPVNPDPLPEPTDPGDYPDNPTVRDPDSAPPYDPATLVRTD
jgi:hypothetical protein